MKQTWRIIRFIAQRWLDWLKALIGCIVALALAVVFSVIHLVHGLHSAEKDWTE